MATSCPIFGLSVDPAFLRFVDADGNGRIISNELREALRWLSRFLKPAGTWLKRQPNLPINLINTDLPEGKALESAARRVIKNLKLKDATEVSLGQVRNRQLIMAQADYNGDGIIPPEVVKDPGAMQFVRDIITVFGGIADTGGLKGVNEALLDQFRKEASAYLQWYTQGIIPEGQTETTVMPFGASTPRVFQATAAIRDKLEQFFTQCALVQYDPRTVERIWHKDAETANIDYSDRQSIVEHLRLAPLARPNANGILPLDESVNAFYHDSIKNFLDQLVIPMFGAGTTTLTEAQWRQVLDKFAPYEAWLKAEPDTAVESLGVDKLRSYLDSSYGKTIRDMIARDKSVASEIQQLQNLEKLILYHQWLSEFVNNYVSFPRLFDPGKRAIFEMGTLVLGGYEFAFSIKVENRTVHSSLARNSGICLLYLQITGSRPEDNYEIAVPVTKGSAKNIYVGKRGVFFTVAGRELDAQIVQIVENPISLWQSIKEPFRRVKAMLGARFSQISSSIQKESEKTIIGTPPKQQSFQVGAILAQDESGQSGSSAPASQTRPVESSDTSQETSRSSGTARDMMIGVGLLVAGLGTAIKFLADAAKQLTQPRTLQVLLIMIGVFILVSILATGASAWWKLRQRDLGGLLQASGWAINGRMRLIRPMARFFCRKTRIPKGSRKYHRELLVPMERLARKGQRKDDLV